MIIRPEQIETLDKVYKSEVLEKWITELAVLFPETAGRAGPDVVKQWVVDDLNAGRNVGIFIEEDQRRLIRLRYRLIEVQAKIRRDAATLILENREWTSTKRLDFIDKHILRKAASS
jgi:hypothetical protein